MASDFLKVNAFVSLETSHAEMNISMRCGKLRKGWSLSSNLEFEAKTEVKSFALHVEEDMTLGPFIIVGTTAMPLFIIWLVIFQNLRDPICFFSTLA